MDRTTKKKREKFQREEFERRGRGYTVKWVEPVWNKGEGLQSQVSRPVPPKEERSQGLSAIRASLVLFINMFSHWSSTKTHTNVGH